MGGREEDEFREYKQWEVLQVEKKVTEAGEKCVSWVSIGQFCNLIYNLDSQQVHINIY